MSETIPRQYLDYALGFLRAMFAITSDVTGFDDGLKDAYRDYVERYPPDGDYEDDA
jgi:hypothetical protein